MLDLVTPDHHAAQHHELRARRAHQREIRPQPAAVERSGASVRPPRYGARPFGMVIGVRMVGLELYFSMLLEVVDRLRARRQECFTQSSRTFGADFAIKIGACGIDMIGRRGALLGWSRPPRSPRRTWTSCRPPASFSHSRTSSPCCAAISAAAMPPALGAEHPAGRLPCPSQPCRACRLLAEYVFGCLRCLACW